MPFRRDELAKKIADRLNVVSNQLKTRTRASFTDANHSLEFVMQRFFNALFGWSLVDLNAERPNFPAADLGDRDRRIAMQITNEDASQKITGTRDKAVEHGLGKDFARLIIFFLLSEKPGMPKKFVQPDGGPKIECWDLADLLKQMGHLPDVDALAAAVEVLDEELGTVAAGNVVASLHQLPPRPEGFVGREADLAKLRALNPWAGAHLTGLRGMGGIGKTALALVLAHEWAARFPDAQLFLDARGTQADPPSARALMEQVIRAFAPDYKPEDTETAVKGKYLSVLHGRKALILLDNASDAKQAEPLAPPHGCALIFTSRHTFDLAGATIHGVKKMEDAEAAKLLTARYKKLSDSEVGALVELCAGLPLALRIAESHIYLDAVEREGTASVTPYVNALRNARLRTFDQDADSTAYATISETLRLSEARLPEPEREAWRRLGVFTASFDARAAQAVAGADEAMLGHLLRRSLLEREGAERFKVHDLAADYACTQIGDNAVATLRLAHAKNFTTVCQESHILYNTKGRMMDALALFDRERTQIEAAYTWLAACADEAAARQMLALVNAVVYTGQELRFHPRQRIAWLESQLLAARHVKERQMEAAALGNLGIAHYSLGDARKAIEYYEQARAIGYEIGYERGEAFVLLNLGNAHAALGEAGKAIECYEQALVIDRKIGDRRAEGVALGNLGVAYKNLGDVRRAIEVYEQQLVIVREIGDRHGEGNALGNLGNAHEILGEVRKCIECHEQALVIMRRLGDRRGESQVLGNLGNAHAALGEARKAIGFYDQRLVIAHEIGDRRGEGHTLWNAALVLQSLGKQPKAIARAAAALTIFEAIEHPRAAQVRAKLAEWRAT